MTERNHYGSEGDDVALVPGTLTAYRHFALRPDSSLLAPMNDANGDVYSTHGGVFEARCINPTSWSFPALEYEHESPKVDCTCGFYAHYEERGDFYRGGVWTDSPIPIVTGRLAYHVFSGQPAVGGVGYGVARAVVELSGKVVMGSVGVRAQKMKIKALAVDWGKFHRPPGEPWLSGDSAGEVYRFYESACSTVAARYGAEYFTDQEAMLEKYPRPDLSALGLAPAKPKSEHALDIGFKGITVNMSPQTWTALRQQLASFSASFDVIDADVIDADVIDADAEKNRPAPPATDID